MPYQVRSKLRPRSVVAARFAQKHLGAALVGRARMGPTLGGPAMSAKGKDKAYGIGFKPGAK